MNSTNSWIPVEKELPKEWDLVLIAISQERRPVCARVRYGGGRVYFVPDDREDYLANEFGTPVLSPTHWQPLPEPPKDLRGDTNGQQ